MRVFGVVLALLLIAFAVCVSSAPSRRRRQTCEDRVPRLCQRELQPHHCYLEHNLRLCCRTCQSHRRNNPDCQYGDQNVRITRKNDDGQVETFSCRSYIQRYGDFHCENEDRFRQYCCESCQ